MFHEFPYTNFSEMNLDWLICACKKNEGLHLAIVGDTLRLLNKDNEVISNVTISYAEKALTDVDGRNIKAYLISAGVAGDTLVFTSGDQVITTITVPYAEKSKYDIYHNELTDYVLNVQPVGQKIRITKGDTTVTEFDCPFALQAASDTDGNAIQTYACDLTVDGNLIQLRDRAGRVLSAITVPFAVNATNAVNAQNAAEATHALNADEADHADEADSADYALLSTDATNAVESVAISGDNVIFTTYGGVQTTIQSPFSVKAQKDDLGNVIKTTYVASVSANAGTGEISFLDALGNVITTIIPQVEVAKKDTYGNTIADYIKQILVDSNSNYVSVVHGTGTTDSILINYSTHALDDINDQAIHNTYITYLECKEDVDDGHWKLYAYDGDTPKALLFTLELVAYSAQTDINGKALTSYVADLDISGKDLIVKDGESNVLETLALPIPPVYVIKCSDSVAETSWTDWQAAGRTLATPTLYKDGVQISDWSELTPDCNVSFEYTSDDTNYHTFKLSEVSANPGYGSSTYQFEYIGSESGSLPDSFAYIVRLGFFAGNMTTKKGYRIPLAAQGGGGGSVSILDLTDGQGNPLRFDNATAAGTVQLQLSGTAQTFSQVSALLQAGTVVIKDSASSLAPIEFAFAGGTTLIVPRFNGNTLDRLKLIHQWSGNYGATAM